MIAPAHFDRCIHRQHLPRLQQLRLGTEHMPGQDQRLRPGATFGEPESDQKLIYARLDRFGPDRI